MSGLGELSSYLLLILAGFLPNEVWRWLGVMLSRGLDESSEIVIWVRSVATAVLAGVIARLILFAPGALANIPLALRVGAVAAGFATFLLLRRSVLAGLIAGETVLVCGALLLAR